jgi:hypothetical protein
MKRPIVGDITLYCIAAYGVRDSDCPDFAFPGKMHRVAAIPRCNSKKHNIPTRTPP